MARFLILDDDEDLGSVVEMILQMEGHDTAVFKKSDDAAAMQRSRPADVLITDIFMPERDGLETIQQFRREFPKVKIIAMSGGGDTLRNVSYLFSAREVGAVQVIRKPFEREALLEVVRQVLAGSAPA
jgi:DNA-binding NtrC family response regulator